jgi:hypothetical protein
MGKPHSAVFLAKVPKSFKPAHAHTAPDEILGGKYLARRLSIANAAKFAEAYNLAHLPSTGKYRHKWAIAIAGLDRKYDFQHVNRGQFSRAPQAPADAAAKGGGNDA